MTTFVLKIIAVATMLIDHIGAVFPDAAPEIFRSVGRVAFPIFAYMLAQGCRYTKNIYKYMLRLGIFALVSEIPFDLALKRHHVSSSGGMLGIGVNFLSDTNIFYTLFLAAACIAIYDKLKDRNRFLSILAVLPPILIAEVLGSDYGAFGVAWIFFIYMADTEKKAMSAIALTAGIMSLYGFSAYAGGCVLNLGKPWYLYFALISVPLILLHNGKQGPKFKWAFYIFYPLHLAILALLVI